MTKPRRRRPTRAPEAARIAKNQGLAPGTAVYTGDAVADAARLTLIRYDPDAIEEIELGPHDPIEPGDGEVRWYNVDGLSDLPLIGRFQATFTIHPLTIEDILNVTTPAKAEELAGNVFVVIPMASVVGEDTLPEVDVEQLSILAGPGWVATFQERPGDVLGPVRQRLHTASGRIRQRGADYLLHAICDAVVDSYFVVLAAFEKQVLALEEEAVHGRSVDLPRRVHLLNSRLYDLRRRIWPLLAAIAVLLRMETPLFDKRTKPFLRDLQEHARQAVEILDGARDRLQAVLQLHLALQGHRMNEVMRLLTIVATIFIPLTFIAGIYGMNFEVMPELHWAWGYPVALVAMAAVAVAMLGWFRWRGWL